MVTHLPNEEVTASPIEERQLEYVERQRRIDRWQCAHDLVHAAGQRYQRCTLDTFQADRPEQRAVVTALREYVCGDFEQGVVLWGPVGGGKDHLAFAVCRAAVASGKSVKWINGQTWLGNLRDAMDTDRTEASLIAELARPAVLCLSDPLPPFGSLTQYQSTMMYRLIDARYTRNRATICTLNVADDGEADERLGEPTWDRLCDGAWKLFCGWPSYRRPVREIKPRNKL
jgi:DNA replication protein DnaC